jgi:hypothetical protein
VEEKQTEAIQGENMNEKNIEAAYLRLSMLHSEALLHIQFLEKQLAKKSLWFRVKLFLSGPYV